MKKHASIINLQELMISAVDNPSNAAEWALAEMINQPGLEQSSGRNR